MAVAATAAAVVYFAPLRLALQLSVTDQKVNHAL